VTILPIARRARRAFRWAASHVEASDAKAGRRRGSHSIGSDFEMAPGVDLKRSDKGQTVNAGANGNTSTTTYDAGDRVIEGSYH
jgi:hypothetical protein